MEAKFAMVIEEFSKHEYYIDDDVLIHAVLAKCGILESELSEFMEFLKAEYSRTGNDKVEQLQYGVNFIFEAQEKGYTVNYPSLYIKTNASESNK